METSFDADKGWSAIENQVAAAIERRKKRFRYRIAAVCAVLGLALAGLYSWSAREQVFVTGAAAAEVLLPDGSSVLLNRRSTLRYPRSFFFFSSRPVFLDGEGFFKVRRDPGKPFTINAPHTRTTVLGTSFTLRDDADSKESMLTVETGRVSFRLNGDKRGVIVAAQQQISADHVNNSIKPHRTKDDNHSAWRTGVMEFRNAPMREVVKVLAAYYDTTIILEDSSLASMHFTGKFDHHSIEQSIRAIAFALALESDHEDGTIRLRKVKGGQP